MEDLLAVEEPLEIRLRDGRGELRSVAVTMRTPGHDRVLALGFLYSEGILFDLDQVQQVAHRATFSPEGAGNVLEVTLRAGELVDWGRLQRNFYTTSSCGVCGKASLDAVTQQLPPFMPRPSWTVPAHLLCSLPEKLREAQRVFGQTGGLHAAAVFSPEGELLILREDVGRHNAMDKLLGEALQRGLLPLQEHPLLVSGRASFELVQKALMGGIELMAAIGAPSSLAAELAADHGMTLAGFLSGHRFNIYSGQQRITP